MAGMKTNMAQADVSAIPDCMASMGNDAMHKPGKCGIAECIAMMASGTAMMFASGSLPPVAITASERQHYLAIVTKLRGRSTAPEPEPPSAIR